jgi:hypothetical protein
MASKQVTDRLKSSRAVAAAASAHGQSIASGFEQALAPYLTADEVFPDVALLASLIGRKIAADTTALVQADEAHERELSDDAEPREQRDRAAMKVRAVLVDLRAAIDMVYEAPGLTKLGLDQPVSEDPSVLATTATAMARILGDPSVKLPKPRRAAMKVDRQGFAAEIDVELPPLIKALAKVATEDREKAATLSKRQGAMSRSDQGFATCAAWLAASCTVAGLGDLAAKVRPSGHKPGRTAEAEAEEEGDDALPEVQ